MSLESWLLDHTNTTHKPYLRRPTHDEFRRLVDQHSDKLQVLRDVLEGVWDASLLERIAKTDLAVLLEATAKLGLSDTCFKAVNEMASTQQDLKRSELVKCMVALGAPRMPLRVFPEYERLVDQFGFLTQGSKQDPKCLSAWVVASFRDLSIHAKQGDSNKWFLSSPGKRCFMLPDTTVWADTAKQCFLVLDVVESSLKVGYFDDLATTKEVASFEGSATDKFVVCSTSLIAYNHKTTKLSIMQVVEPWSVLTVEVGTTYKFVNAQMFGDMAVMEVCKASKTRHTFIVVDTRFSSLVYSFNGKIVKFASFKSCLAWAVQANNQVFVVACFFMKKTKGFKSAYNVITTNLGLSSLRATNDRGVFVVNLTSDSVRVDLNVV
jgi:hypothetical protein